MTEVVSTHDVASVRFARHDESCRQRSLQYARFASTATLWVRLLILTGRRLNEIMTLKSAYLDVTDRVLRLPDSKTGAKVVHPGQPAIDLLQAAERVDDNPWVITGALLGKHLSDLQPF